MNEYIIQKQTLDDIADAINEKAGTSGQMTPVQMPDKIAAIQTKEDLTELNTEINELDETTGTKTVAQMTTAVGNANTTIDTQGSLLDDVIEALEGKISPPLNLESKTLTLGAAAPSTVVPSAGHDGLSSVPIVLDTNVIKAENIAKDVQMLGVTGTHEGGGAVYIGTYTSQSRSSLYNNSLYYDEYISVAFPQSFLNDLNSLQRFPGRSPLEDNGIILMIKSLSSSHTSVVYINISDQFLNLRFAASVPENKYDEYMHVDIYKSPDLSYTFSSSEYTEMSANLIVNFSYHDAPSSKNYDLYYMLIKTI